MAGDYCRHTGRALHSAHVRSRLARKRGAEHSTGYLERITAERLQKKLDISTALTAEQKAVWAADIAAVTVEQPIFKGPDSSNPNHYLDGLTDQEFQALNSMAQRYGQEINLD